MTPTDVLAIIGAITGVIGTVAGIGALVWDFYKWRYSERVRLKVTAIPGFITKENSDQKYISVSVCNIGKLPTTIKLISLHGFNNKKELKKRNGKRISIIRSPDFGQLPIRLNPGDDWTCLLRQDLGGIKEYLEFRHFIIQMEDTMSEFPFRAEIDKELFKKSLSDEN